MIYKSSPNLMVAYMVGFNIFLIGFSSYEKSTIETFLRLAGKRAPHWALTSQSSQARVVLFSANSESDIKNGRSLLMPWQKVILVGNSDLGTAWPVLPRPLKLTAMLALLDDMADIKAGNAQKPAPTLQAPVIANPTMTDIFANITTKMSQHSYAF